MDTLPPIGLAYKAILSATSLCSYVVHFIVCSRDINHTPPTLNNKQESYTYILNNDFFTFTPNEYKSLSLLYLNELTEFSGLDKIYNITEGWVYGIVSAFSFINNHANCLRSMILQIIWMSFSELSNCTTTMQKNSIPSHSCRCLMI